MLTKEQIEILTDKYITGLYDDLEREVIGDIARRVKNTERFTETAELMAQSLREQGYSTARIQAQVHKALDADKEYQRVLAENTREYKQDVKKLIEKTEEEAGKAGDVFVATAGDMSWNDDMQLWKAHNVDLKKPNSLNQLYRAIAKQTTNELKNITNSTGFKNTVLGTTGVYNAYRRTMDLAMVKVSSGAFSYQQAVKDCVDQLAKSGLRTIDYASGRSYQLDTAARMCIRTGANQLSGKIQEMNLKETETPLVYVDAHAGSRPEHAVWQGQVYAYNPDGTLRDGSKAGEKYDDFFHATDYGSVIGLMGANCAHHFYPYWEGDPLPDYDEPDPMEIDGKEYTYYEATQEMRRQERGIRQTKREIEAMRTLGEDTSALERKLTKQVQDYRKFSNSANINPRSYVLGVKSGTTAAPKPAASKPAAKKATTVKAPEAKPKKTEEKPKVIYKQLTEEEYTKIKHEITAEERKIIYGKSHYSGYVNSSNARKLNEAIRNGEPLSVEYQKIKDTLSDVISRNTMPENVEVIRYVDTDALKDIAGIVPPKVSMLKSREETVKEMNAAAASAKPGYIDRENNFLSTSLLPEKNVMDRKSVEIHIKVPQGTHCYITTNKKESEAIFGIGTEMSLDSIVYDTGQVPYKWVLNYTMRKK